MKMRHAIATSTLGLVLFAAAAASADVVQMHFVGTAQGRNVHIHTPTEDLNVFAGQLRHDITSGTGVGASLVGEHITFCPDLTERVTSAGAAYQIVPIATMPDSGAQPAM